MQEMLTACQTSAMNTRQCLLQKIYNACLLYEINIKVLTSKNEDSQSHGLSQVIVTKLPIKNQWHCVREAIKR